MTKLVWNRAGERFYETGVDRGVLYVSNQAGVAWNGLVSVTETPSGGEVTAQYAGNSKYINQTGLEEFGGTIEAFTYPEEFEACDGTLSMDGLSVSQQGRSPFGFSYRTLLGNDIEGAKHGYKIHLVYNAMAVPTEIEYSSTDDAPEALTFSWEFTTTPIDPMSAMMGNTHLKPFSHVSIDSRKTDPGLMVRIENYLYGTKTEPARMFSLVDLIHLFENPLASLMIEANPNTGLSPIRDTYSSEGDLIGDPLEGLYSATSNSRLTETSVPGLYTLE